MACRWGLICSADDKARAQHLDKIRRKFIQDQANGVTVPTDFSEDRPWTTCLRALALDDAYWNEQVRYPAAAWTAGGSRGVPMAAAEQVAMAHHPGVKDVGDVLKDESDGTGRKRQSNRDKRLAKMKRIRDDREELHRFRNKTDNDGRAQGQGKSKGKGKTKDQAGTQICFSWANASGQCANVAPGGACLGKVKRAHKCQICLSPSHRNSECPQAA